MAKTSPSEEGRRRRRAPKGHFVVYVGEEQRRFVVPVSYLKTPIFQQLLEKAAEEFGIDHSPKGIVLPCDEWTFRQIMDSMAKES